MAIMNNGVDGDYNGGDGCDGDGDGKFKTKPLPSQIHCRLCWS